MLNMFKKKKVVIKAPVSGQVIKLCDIDDEVFSSGMMGEGLAIEPNEAIFVAPADGEIIVLPKTKHAFGMRLTNGMEILVHIGMDTVHFDGQGFEVLATVGQKVKTGAPIIKVDMLFFQQRNVSLLTPVIVLNQGLYQVDICDDQQFCQSGETDIMKGVVI